MKKLIIALFLALPLGVFAQQNLKIGYINKQEILTAMPEANTAMKALEDMNLKYITEGKKLEEELYKLKTTKTRDEYIASRVKEFILNKEI